MAFGDAEQRQRNARAMEARARQKRRKASSVRHIPDRPAVWADDRGMYEFTCQNPDCGKVFTVAYRSHAVGRRFCSRACHQACWTPPNTPEIQQRKATKMRQRKGKRNPNYRNGSRQGYRDRDGERRWYVALKPACEVCNGAKRRGGKLALHHIVYRQHLASAGGDMWDLRNGLTCCTSCHMSHHRRGAVIPVALLPDDALAYAAETLGVAAYDYLRRYYAGDDPRLEGLLDA